MAKIVAKYKLDTSTDTIELYLPEDSDGNTELSNAVGGGVEYVSGTVDNVTYSGWKLIDQIVVNEGLEDDLITTSKIAALAVSTEKLAELVVTAGKLATGAVEEDKLGAASVTATKIANLAVGTAAIAVGAITTAKIGNAQITNALIDDLAVNDAKINDLSANKINAGSMNASYITAGTITATQISGDQLDVVAAKCGTLEVDETLNVATSGVIKSGQTAYNTGTGFWMEYNGGTPRMSLGTSSEGFTWNGSAFTINGDVIATGNISAKGVTDIDFDLTADGTVLSAQSGLYDQWLGYYVTVASVTLETYDATTPIMFTIEGGIAVTGGGNMRFILAIFRGTTLIYTIRPNPAPLWDGYAPTVFFTGTYKVAGGASGSNTYHIKYTYYQATGGTASCAAYTSGDSGYLSMTGVSMKR